MKIQFLGATGTVTGSKYVLTDGTTKILIDCGLFQGPSALRERNWTPLPFDAKRIHAVILTHAHIDHSGYIPLLVKQGFQGPIYCSEATFDLCKILLPDSGHLQEEDARYAAKHGYSRHANPMPLYTAEDAEASLKFFHIKPYGVPFQVADECMASFHHAGHILGASFVQCTFWNTKILFSGDIGRPHDPVMIPPAIMQSTDYLVIESTYGDRRHEEIDPMVALESLMDETLKKGGSLLIPAFAVGRAQSLLYYIQKLQQTHRLPRIPIYLDSPMAIQATDLLCKYHNEHHLSTENCTAIEELPIYSRTVEDSKAISQNPLSKIIISASGMLSGGRAVHHLKQLIEDDRHTIVLTGFQAPGTLGAQLLEGVQQIKIHGDYFHVKAKIVQLTNTSAHSDYVEILEWLQHFTHSPRMTFITHGETHAAQALKNHIETTLGWTCQIPLYLETVSL